MIIATMAGFEKVCRFDLLSCGFCPCRVLGGVNQSLRRALPCLAHLDMGGLFNNEGSGIRKSA